MELHSHIQPTSGSIKAADCMYKLPLYLGKAASKSTLRLSEFYCSLFMWLCVLGKKKRIKSAVIGDKTIFPDPVSNESLV